MSNFNSELARITMIDHYDHPRQKIDESVDSLPQYLKGHHDSPSCIDKIDAYVLIKDEKISDIKFSGIGCAICTSSTDIMALNLIGKSIGEAKEIIKNYFNMILEKEYNEEKIKPLLIYKNVSKQANRIKCAITGIEAIKEAIDQHEKTKK